MKKAAMNPSNSKAAMPKMTKAPMPSPTPGKMKGGRGISNGTKPGKTKGC